MNLYVNNYCDSILYAIYKDLQSFLPVSIFKIFISLLPGVSLQKLTPIKIFESKEPVASIPIIKILEGGKNYKY